MTDLREHFEAADRIPAPDLWASVQTKVAQPAAHPTPRALRLVAKGEYPSRRRLVSRKVLTIAAAFVIALLAAGLLVRAFRTPTRVPINKPPLGIFTPVRGWIAELDRSRRLVASDPAGGGRAVKLPGEAAPIGWSPDGTRLLLWDGTVVSADGSIFRVVPRKPGLQGGSFSPDGSQIVYSDYGGSIYVIAADGGGDPLVLARREGHTFFSFPAWSPDGTRVAYDTHSRTTGWTISIMRADGTDQQVLLDLSGRRFFDLGPLAWSPDGSRLAFTINPDCCSTDRTYINIVGSDGSGLKTITAHDGSSSPTWSPDGSLIAFLRGRGDVFTATPDGAHLHALLIPEALDQRITWNPVQPN